MTGERQWQSAREAGFRMPAEWERHARCWMMWPDQDEFIWPDIGATQAAYAAVVAAVLRFEPVGLLVSPAALTRARKLCPAETEFVVMDLDDAWARDCAPNFLTSADGEELAASIFHFNAWGGKYDRYRNDAAVGHRLAELLGVRTFSANVFMEGGGINVDGEGTVLTTDSCILNRNRNPGLTKPQAEAVLGDALGAERVIWLPGDPEDEETDGHVDGVACFVAPGKVLCMSAGADQPRRQAIAAANQTALRQATDARGRALEIIELPEANSAPGWGQRFCRSYINFYIANDGIVFPAYGIPEDDVAAEIVKACFPGRELVQVDVTHIALGGGGIHCITQQQPAV